MIDLKMIYIFSLGMFLTLLYYLEEMIEKQEYKTRGWLTISFLSLVKSLLGGILIVLIFYTLEDLKIEFTLFEVKFKLQTWANLLIAGTISLFGSDMFKMIKHRVETIANKRGNE